MVVIMILDLPLCHYKYLIHVTKQQFEIINILHISNIHNVNSRLDVKDRPVISIGYVSAVSWKDISIFKKSMKILNGESEAVNRKRIDNTMAKRKRTKGQTIIYKTVERNRQHEPH